MIKQPRGLLPAAMGSIGITMQLTRREFIQALAALGLAGWNGNKRLLAKAQDIYDIPRYGNVSLMHFTDCHAQLLPILFREPDIHLGLGPYMENLPPHLVGKHLLKYYKIPHGSPMAYATTYLDYMDLAQKYGRMGGFAHLATLVKNLRQQRPGALLLDGGDTWQGSATSLWTKGQDMVDACIKLGVDIMTGHWEFTYGMERVLEVLENDFKGKIEFIAQNVVDDAFEDPVFKPYTLRDFKDAKIAIIGQAFPYTRVAHPKYFTEGYQFGLRPERLQKLINEVKAKGAHAVILLSHNGIDVDLHLARNLSGIDFILGGHTHDAVPQGISVANGRHKTMVFNSGTNGKFLSLLDIDIQRGKIKGHRYKLLPVFSNLLPADRDMYYFIEQLRKPYLDKLDQRLAVTESLLFRRGTFNGSFDQLIVDALRQVQDAEVALSPGFRWGTTLMPGDTIRFEDVMAQTAITYPIVTRNQLTGRQIKDNLEDVADNRFNFNPYYQQGGDMVRSSGLSYTLDAKEKMGGRIKDLMVNGKAISNTKKYWVAGWGSMEKQEAGKPVWELLSDYLRDKKTIKINQLSRPKLQLTKKNLGQA